MKPKEAFGSFACIPAEPDLHPDWVSKLTFQGRLIGLYLISKCKDPSSLRLSVGDDWKDSLCTVMAVKGTDRRNAKAALQQLADRGFLSVGDGFVQLNLTPLRFHFGSETGPVVIRDGSTPDPKSTQVSVTIENENDRSDRIERKEEQRAPACTHEATDVAVGVELAVEAEAPEQTAAAPEQELDFDAPSPKGLAKSERKLVATSGPLAYRLWFAEAYKTWNESASGAGPNLDIELAGFDGSNYSHWKVIEGYNLAFARELTNELKLSQRIDARELFFSMCDQHFEAQLRKSKPDYTSLRFFIHDWAKHKTAVLQAMREQHRLRGAA